MNAPSLVTKWSGGGPQLQSVLRIVAALMFILPGTMKLFGGTLLLLGLFTRPVAFLLSGEMAVAYFQFHFPGGFWPVTNGGTTAALYCFVWLYLSAAGGGPWSLDALRRRK